MTVSFLIAALTNLKIKGNYFRYCSLSRPLTNLQ